MEPKHGRGYVYSLQYHIVWCVKYRRKILTPQVKDFLIETLENIAIEKGFTILEINTDLDHIHILVDCNPQHYIPDLLKIMKGRTSRLLMQKFPYLKNCLWGGHILSHQYQKILKNR